MINCISNQIYTVFNKPNIYVEHIKQGFLSPCFCIRYVKTEEKACISNRYRLFNKIEIVYFPKKSDNINDELNKILNELFDKFLMLKFEKGFIKGENMEGYIEDETVKFYIEWTIVNKVDIKILKKDKKVYLIEIK